MSRSESLWARLVEKRAARLKTNTKEASKEIPSVYLAALRSKAARLGISADELERQHESGSYPYPTRDCIRPTQLAEFIEGEEPSEEMLSHLRQCKQCCALLDMASPSADRLKSLLEEVRIFVGERAAEAHLPDLFEASILTPTLKDG